MNPRLINLYILFVCFGYLVADIKGAVSMLLTVTILSFISEFFK